MNGNSGETPWLKHAASKTSDKGTLIALLLLWSGAILIFVTMVSFWRPVKGIGNNPPGNTQNTRIKEDGIYVDQLLLATSDLNLPDKSSLINTVLKNMGEDDSTLDISSAARRNSIYERVLEQRLKKATGNDGGFTVKPIP